jgi:hypothetical protein
LRATLLFWAAKSPFTFFYKTLKLHVVFYLIKNEAYLLFSNLKFACNFAEQKSWKSICYFENHKLGRSPLGTRICGLERVFKK